MRRLLAPLLIAAFAALVAAVSLSGEGDQTVGHPSVPPAGRFAVDGHEMFIECRGDDGPTVILESGLGVDSTSTWAAVRPQVARFATVCLYDRAGMGASEPGPKPRTASVMADELHGLLQASGVHPPYVLTGASLGGLVARLYASRHPGDVHGVVLVDAMHPDFDRRVEPLLGHEGARVRRQALSDNPEGVTYEDLLASDDEVREAEGFPPVPLIVLKHGISFDPGGEPDPAIERLWGELQEANAELSPKGEVVVARRSHHRIAEDEPELVVQAIREVSRRPAP